MGQITVNVTYDSESQTLGVGSTQETIILEDPKDTVSWIASPDTQLPLGSALLIQFKKPFGPFQAIRSVGPRNLLAKGNTANVDLFAYSLFLVTSTESANLIKAGPFTVDNRCTVGNTSPWVKINATQAAENGPWSLDIQQNPLSLHQGDNALLEVTGLPQDFVFAFFFPTGSPNQGPFSTYFTTRQDGTGSARMYVSTFESDAVGPVSYHVSLWNELGQFLISQDPSVDGLGRPPGT